LADLTAKFRMIDEMSSKLDAIGQSGDRMVDNFERAENAINSAVNGVSSGAGGAVTSIDGVAASISDAAQQTDHWTDALEHYDQGLLEATYSTQELVDMGLKSSSAMDELEAAMALCGKSAKQLEASLESGAASQKNLTTAQQHAEKVMRALTDAGGDTSEAQQNLTRASENAESAMEELAAAMDEAQQATEHYNRVMDSGTQDTRELEAAAERAGHAAEALAAANEKAANATDELAKATEEGAEAAEEAEKSGKDAVEGIAEALAAAGITVMVKETAEAVYELADSFSEAKKTIVASTGATGDELDALMASAERVFSSSHAESLDQVAASMSSVKKATGLVGEELERATQYGLALEDTLGYEVSQSARTASSLMKNFGLTAEEAYNLITIGAQSGADKNGDLLDVLNEYSAHYSALGLSAEEFMSSLIDGAEAGVFSVDKVGDAVKEFNIRAKDGSETSAQAFEMLGLDAEEMAAKFAAGGDTASEAFFTVVNALNSLDDPMAKNTAAVALFGTMYEDLEANILPVLGNVEGGTIKMHDALSVVTDDAKSLKDQWTEAGNSLETAFSNAVSPAITSASETLAGFAKSAGDYLQEHPGVAKAITAVGVGLGVVVVGIAGVAFATSSAIPALVSFGTALNTALGPIGWVSLALSGVVAAGTALALMWEKAEDETADMTAATREQYYELQDMQAAYEDACATYGETSEEASRLKYQVDELSASFEANRQTIEEFAAECQDVIDAHTDMVSSFEENNKSLDNSEASTFALIQKLSDLADGTYKSADSQGAMQAIIDELNGSVDGLNLTYSDLILNQDGVIANIKEMAKAEAERARQQEMYDEYVQLIQQQATEEEQLAAATDEVTAAQKRFNAANADYQNDLNKWGDYGAMMALFTGSAGAWDDAKGNLDTLTEKQNGLQAALDDTTARMREIEEEWGIASDAMEENEEATISWEDAATAAFATVKEDMEKLVEAYGEVYNAALESYEGQFGLFDEASTKSEEYMNSTVENAQEALNSQLEYWNTYAANIETLKNLTAEQLGITQENYDAMMAYVQDGSAEAAGLAASMVKSVEEGNTEAITDLANTMADVSAKREEIANTTADWVTNFSSEMDRLTEKMNDTVTKLNLDTEADAAAKATIQAYADAILASKTSAVSAAQQVANAVSAALRSANTTINVGVNGSVPGHADGTTYAEDVFMAGEEGPELIVGHEGATVFPTTETDRIIEAVNGMNGITSVSFADEFVTALSRYANTRGIVEAGGVLSAPQTTQEQSSGTGNNQTQEKIIRLEIAGSGSIAAGAGASKDEIVELMYTNLKPVLLSIVQEEVFEEGDSSYDY